MADMPSRYPQGLYDDTTSQSAASIWAYWASFGLQPPTAPPAQAAEASGAGWERVGGPTAESVPEPVPTTQPATQPAQSQPPRPTTRPAGPTTRPAGGYGGGANAGPGGVPLGNLHMETDPVKGRSYPTGEVQGAATMSRAATGGQPYKGGGVPTTQPAPTTQPSAPPEPTGAPQRTTRILQDKMHGATAQQYAQYKRAGFVWIPNPGRPPAGVDPNNWGHWGKKK
ncbi:MAG: hypothetical protein M0R06_08890 [Sphaerochaeta sp.]|jgi:hypothetical protein|nr:hypothetical protein [Sphaerochaeta sp.]